MAGEAQLLERRRLYHCAAYNCAIAAIRCVFTELKFYQGFLFSEKPEKVGPSRLPAGLPGVCAPRAAVGVLLQPCMRARRAGPRGGVSPASPPGTQASSCGALHSQNLLIFENLIDLKRCYTFPIEVEVSESFRGVSRLRTLSKCL